MKIKFKPLAFVLGILFVTFIIYFFGANVFKNSAFTNTSKSKKLQIATSFYPMYFFASQIGGEKADTYNITPAGSEPHEYEPTTKDLVRISHSDMLVLNGGKVDTWGNKVKDQLQGTNTLIVIAGENLINKQVSKNGQEIQDPHVWLDPILSKKEVKIIEQGFEKIDPANKIYYQVNAKKLEDELDKLDAEYRRGLSSCLIRDFVTSHAAFGRLADQYGINQVAISGISPDEEPSSKTLATITELVKQKDIKIIFFEKLVSPKLSDTVASETGAKAMALDPLEGMTQDDIKAGHNYFTVMRNNLSALQAALQCIK